MKVALIGAGVQGQVLCTMLVESPDVDEVRVADKRFELAKRLADYLKSDKVSVHSVDASKIDELLKVTEGVDVVVNATVPMLNLTIMQAAFKSRAHYIDLASLYETIDEQLGYSEEWKKAGLTAMMGMGYTPGLTDVLAKYAADRLDRVYEIRVRMYGDAKSKEPIAFWSPAVAWDDIARSPVVFMDGEFKAVPPFSGVEEYEFPDLKEVFPDVASNKQTCIYHAHEEPHYMGRFFKDKGLRYADFKVAYARWEVDKEIVNMGLASTEPIEVDGVKVIPRNVLIQLSPKPLFIEEYKKKIEEGVLIDQRRYEVVEVRGEKGGKEVKHTMWFYMTLKKAHERIPGATATSYLTNVSAFVATLMLGRGEIETRGVITGERLSPEEVRKFLTEIAKRGVPIHERIETTAFP